MNDINIKIKVDEIINKINKKDFLGAKKTSEILIKQNKKDFQLYNIHATILYELNEITESEKTYKTAIEINPSFFDARYNLSKLYYELKNYKNSLYQLEKCKELRPNSADVYLLFGNLHLKNKEFKLAEKNYLKIININSQDHRSYFSLGNLYEKQKNYIKAIEYFKKSIENNNLDFASFNNLGVLYQNIGFYELAIENFKKVITLKKRFLRAYSNYIYCLNFCEKFDFSKYFEVIKQYKKNIPIFNLKTPLLEKKLIKKKLKLGFVSGDFGVHPVSFFLLNIIEKINKKKFELYAYSNSNRKDWMTEKLSNQFDTWVNIKKIRDDQEVIEKIRKDQIDILIDLSGHTANNRLSIFVNRSAPVQITWLGYNNTTGLNEIDYIIADPHVLTDKIKNIIPEKILSMQNTFQCIRFEENLKIKKNVNKKKEIIFGNFGRLSKINNECIKIWSEILNKKKDSKLYLKCNEFFDEDIKEMVKKKFEKYNIKNNRLILDGKSYSREEYLNLYNEVDIMLDTFPYPGITTSLEALWMGVPIITLVGETYYSRIGFSINNNLELNDWNTFSKKEYIKKSVEKSSNYELLFNLKSNLRKRFIASPLYDLDTFLKEFENLLLRTTIN